MKLNARIHLALILLDLYEKIKSKSLKVNKNLILGIKKFFQKNEKFILKTCFFKSKLH